jgi:K+-transporting ATPase ATPase B chain
MSTKPKARPLFDPPIVRQAVIDSFLKLDPRHQVRNPVMFVVQVVSILTTILFAQAVVGRGEAPAAFILVIAFWLWFTVIFANFAEAMAEGRGKAQAESLRRARRDVQAKRLSQPRRGAAYELVPGPALRKDDVVLVTTFRATARP